MTDAPDTEPAALAKIISIIARTMAVAAGKNADQAEAEYATWARTAIDACRPYLAARSAPEAGKAVDVAMAETMAEKIAEHLEIDWDGDDPFVRSDSIEAGEIARLVARLNIDADRLKLSKRGDLHAICGDVREAAAALTASEAEAADLRRKLEEAELANKRLSDELDNLEQDACWVDDDFSRMTERAEAAEKALYLVTNERDNLSENIAEITSREETDLQAMHARAEAAERKLEEARKALEPFATVGEIFEESAGWSDTDEIELSPEDGPRMAVIKLSHFRRASQALESDNG